MTAVPPNFENDEAAPSLALRVFHHIPPGYLAFTVPDHGCEPLIRCGEVAIIDISDNAPEDGALFLRKAGNSQTGYATYRIEELIPHMCRTTIDGELGLHPAWYLGAHHRPKGRDEIVAWLRAGKPGIFVDGPYLQHPDSARMVRGMLVGRVVGVLAGATASFGASGCHDAPKCRTPLLSPPEIASAARSEGGGVSQEGSAGAKGAR